MTDERTNTVTLIGESRASRHKIERPWNQLIDSLVYHLQTMVHLTVVEGLHVLAQTIACKPGVTCNDNSSTINENQAVGQELAPYKWESLLDPCLCGAYDVRRMTSSAARFKYSRTMNPPVECQLDIAAELDNSIDFAHKHKRLSRATLALLEEKSVESRDDMRVSTNDASVVECVSLTADEVPSTDRPNIIVNHRGHPCDNGASHQFVRTCRARSRTNWTNSADCTSPQGMVLEIPTMGWEWDREMERGRNGDFDVGMATVREKVARSARLITEANKLYAQLQRRETSTKMETM